MSKTKKPAAAAMARNRASSARSSKCSIGISMTGIVIIIIIMMATAPLCPLALKNDNYLVDKWTVGIHGGEEEAHRVALETNAKNLGPVEGFDDIFKFEKRISSSPLPSLHAIYRQKRALEEHPLVSWAEPDMSHERVKRDYVSVHSLLARQQEAPAHLMAANSATGQQQQKLQLHTLVASSVQASSNNSSSSKAYADIGGAYSPLLKVHSGDAISGQDPTSPVNDELWTHQWYLHDNSDQFRQGHQLGGGGSQTIEPIGLNVGAVWKMGYKGAGVVVTILDDGLEWNHTDIRPNYDARASWDMNHNRPEPDPTYDPLNENSHGTRCAGEVAMVANNRKCGVGVAPQARIGGIKCLDGPISDEVEWKSLLHQINYIDIYSASWGPRDDGRHLDGPKGRARRALEDGTKHGRHGKGCLYVWATGNGGMKGDNCACDGYINSIYTLSIGSVTQQGHFPAYGERCSGTLAVACSSGTESDRKIVTADLHNKCTIDFQGTSAAAPLAAGVYALVLEANNNLTWRDVQHLTVWTSNPLPMRASRGWKRNAAGLLFNNRFGFGLLNAKALVEAALSWQTVPSKSICVVPPTSKMPVFLQSRHVAQIDFNSDGCQQHHQQQQQQQHQQQSKQLAPPMLHRQQVQQQQQQQQYNLNQSQKPRKRSRQHGLVSGPEPVIYLEHVQVIIDLAYTSRGSLDMFLVSPSGTVSTLMLRRPLDISVAGFDKWPLMSVHFWAETSIGKWTLIVRDKDGHNNRGQLHNATLVLHGTTVRPHHMQQARVYYQDEAEVQSFLDPVPEFDELDIYNRKTFEVDERSLNDEVGAEEDDFGRDSAPESSDSFVKLIKTMEQADSERQKH